MMAFFARNYLDSLPVGERERLFRTHTPLGFHPEAGDELLLEDNDRFAGTYIIGVQGVGKSGLLQNLIHSDVRKGNAVVVFDPHGDVVNDCVAQLPPELAHRAYVLDMEDEKYPFGANVFESGPLTTEVQRARAVDRIMHIFEVLWPDVLNQQHLPRYVRAAIIVFLHNPGSTLVDMLPFLLEPDVRHHMLQPVRNPSVRLFWQTQYDNLSPKEQMTRVQPLVNRLESLFMGRDLIANIVGQKRTTINFRRAIEERQFIFIKLPVKTLAQDAKLVGIVLLSQLYAAVFSFGDLPASERPGVSTYVDEAQNFVTPDFASLFTEGRKFGMRLTLAHQYRDQLPSFLQQSTVTARTKICFRITPSDASEMAKEFPAAEGELEISHRATKDLLGQSAELPPVVREFVETYLRDLPKGGKVEIKLKMGAADYLLRDGRQPLPVHRASPIGPLDHLFYKVMMSQNPSLPIPEDAIYGLANGGKGFYGAIGWTSAKILTRDIDSFPAHLVSYTPQGLFWRREPLGDKEQLEHCIFHLRMTMHYLAEHPLGKQKSGGGNVAAMLTQIRARQAFVKSDKAVGVIHTHDTPSKLAGDALKQRMFAIREQTRAKYCHPRDDVQADAEVVHESVESPETFHLKHQHEGTFHLRSQQPPAQKPLSRWEEENE